MDDRTYSRISPVFFGWNNHDPNYIGSSTIIDAEFTTVEDVEKEFEKDIQIQNDHPISNL